MEYFLCFFYLPRHYYYVFNKKKGFFVVYSNILHTFVPVVDTISEVVDEKCCL